MITGKTNVVGVIGDPVEHSLSPPMHNAAFKHLKMDYVYVPYHVKKGMLGDAIIGAKSLNIKGLNITIPHKTDVMKHLDALDKSAELIGAVNTIKFDEDYAKGYNTDGIGAVKAIEEISSVKNKKVIILGAGGAARAISFQILMDGAESIVIANRTVANAEQLQRDLVEKLNADVKSIDLGEKLEIELSNADILINTTPIGMYPNVDQEPLVKAELMHENLVVKDCVYNPLQTGLIKEAEKCNAKVVSGLKMLIYQGMEAFRIWTGVTPPLEIFERSLKGQFE
ncbi:MULTISPECIES: shikimate dehydrogenase [Methanobacterium]|uniref:Shikimate dehydrogenase (NADP(+)) n=1 Tax=Methanobacterium bryantii TaxID=2161 RepID=A0A2A2H2M6_METBR|nr:MULTISPECIES: shikimate dehydrogenase [Methanobacterium]OEC88132.1 shikimate dehydrogenase [Methanobacterium sp. A39]PAV03536.1 shikimate dehydrogenase [Methanobacterium bryantii]